MAPELSCLCVQASTEGSATTRRQKLVQPWRQDSRHLGDARPLARSQQLFDQPQLIAHQPRQQEMLAYMLPSGTPKSPSLARMLE
jgi:hypothetical protein